MEVTLYYKQKQLSLGFPFHYSIGILPQGGVVLITTLGGFFLRYCFSVGRNRLQDSEAVVFAEFPQRKDS